MSRLKAFFISILIIFLGCSNDSNNSGPSLDFRGITHTNESGQINGTIDTDDWRIISGTSPYKLAGELPDSFKVNPAYPNPSDNEFNIEFAFPSAVTYEIKIINRFNRTVESLSGEAPAGVMNLVWVAVESGDQPLPNGIYRVVYQFGGVWGYGDIQVSR